MELRSTVIGKRFLNKEPSLKGKMHMTGQGWGLVKWCGGAIKLLEPSNLEIADLCRELALLLHAGVRPDDGLYLLAEEEKDPDHQELMSQLAHPVEEGNFWSKAFEDTGWFPVYVTGLIQVGERAGRTEETLTALFRYYEEQEQIDCHVRSVMTYPVIFLLLMVVIVVLLSQLLPVFNEVYVSLGG